MDGLFWEIGKKEVNQTPPVFEIDKPASTRIIRAFLREILVLYS
jgi:hypothetical protein